jgi:AraC family transcriptional regulator
MVAVMDDAIPAPSSADPLERARAYIEAQLFEALSPASLAARAGLSPYHFSRQFAARFEASPMAYVRARRLVAAAERLVDNPAPNLIDLAFDCGFDSQEGFTRAFKRAHGVPPGQYRRGMSAHLETVRMPTPDHVPALTQSPGPVQKPALRIAGLAGDFDDTNKAEIPALWMRLVPHLPLAGQTSAETYGVCRGINDASAMRYMAGVEIAADAPAPVGLEVVDLPARPYLVFRQEIAAEGLHPQMQAAAKAIWGELLPRSGYKLAHAPDLEYYPPDFQPNKPGYVEWWIPVEA